MKMEQKNGKWIDRIQWAAIVALGAVIIVLTIGCYIREKRAAEEQYIGTIPFANQHIEWTYAKGTGK